MRTRLPQRRQKGAPSLSDPRRYGAVSIFRQHVVENSTDRHPRIVLEQVPDRGPNTSGLGPGGMTSWNDGPLYKSPPSIDVEDLTVDTRVACSDLAEKLVLNDY